MPFPQLTDDDLKSTLQRARLPRPTTLTQIKTDPRPAMLVCLKVLAALQAGWQPSHETRKKQRSKRFNPPTQNGLF